MTRRLVWIHLAGNGLLLWLGYEWLSLGEATPFQLAASVAAALLLLASATWLHGASFAGFRTALRHLAPLLAVAIAAIGIYAFLAWWAGYSTAPAAKLASWLTFQFRKPVKPATVMRYFNAVLWFVRWALLPNDLLPLFSGVANRGWRGFTDFGWRRQSRLYRLAVPLLALAGVWLPLRLIDWLPHVTGFPMELTSFLLRLSAAYLLFVAAALTLAHLMQGGAATPAAGPTSQSPEAAP